LSLSENKASEEKIIITVRERELLEIVARMITYAAREIEGRFLEDIILNSIHKTIKKFTSLQEGMSG
jgi:hypothetical protein